MNAIQLAAIIAQQAVAADLRRRLLQDEVADRRRAQKEVDRLKTELDKALAVRPSIQQEVTTCDA